MNSPRLLHDLIGPVPPAPRNIALIDGEQQLSYGELWRQVQACSGGLQNSGLQRGERVAIYLEKRFETVIACFGATHAGAVFVPINPLLKPAQVGHILRDCGVSVLITSALRLEAIEPVLRSCTDLRRIIIVGDDARTKDVIDPVQRIWADLMKSPPAPSVPAQDSDLAAIFYTSGSTGRSKGVMLSHRNLVVGASSVASYLGNCADDVLLAALPLSFDAGFSQLTTAFHAGARVILLNYLVPRDILLAMQRHGITGITAVPPLYIQLVQQQWPTGCAEQLRYFANTGGHMPKDLLDNLRHKAPKALPFLMYGLTEAFRSTYLPPREVDRRPDSIGKAIPNATVLVLRPDGTPCTTDEPGELVHSGPLVSLGYWNNPEATAERFRPLPGGDVGSAEIAVFSGDMVRRDAEGFLYFVGRRDEMIKSSGYRISPTEIEEGLYATGLIGECVAFGVSHPTLGQSIHVVATATTGCNPSTEEVLAACRRQLPAYMVPAYIDLRAEPLPRNPNGKLDRKGLASKS